jgi:hypothetical protein
MSISRNPPEYIPLSQHDHDHDHPHDHDHALPQGDHHLSTSFNPLLLNANTGTGSHSNTSSRRSSASFNSSSSLTGRKRWRTRQLVVVLLVGAIGVGVWVSSSSSGRMTYRNGDRDDGHWEGTLGMGGGGSTYKPGRLGKELVRRRRMMLGESSTENWEEILGSSSSSSSRSSSSGSSASNPKSQSGTKDLFSLSTYLDEEPCTGYTPGAEKAYSEKCWRARWIEQMDGWGMEDSE